MSDKLYPVSKEWAKRAHVDDASYQAMYAASVNDPEAFWREHGQRIDWFKPYTKVKNTSYKPGKVKIAWFEDGITNVAYNCIDRHLAKRADQVAIIWEGDDPGVSKKITYRELHGEVCRFANVLKLHGVKKGDAVTIYLPMIPEAAYAMLACARIGAVHSIVFGGFSPDSLSNRIEDCDSKVVITADEGLRGGKGVHLKKNVDVADSEGQGRHQEGHRRQAHRCRHRDASGPRRLVSRGSGQGDGPLPASRDEGGRPAVHPLHLRLDRPAQGRAAHHRRLSRLCRDDPPVCLRLSGRRRSTGAPPTWAG
jgi:hypothetical protein